MKANIWFWFNLKSIRKYLRQSETETSSTCCGLNIQVRGISDDIGPREIVLRRSHRYLSFLRLGTTAIHNRYKSSAELL
ncbi:Hypothetical predicted protein [Octopus vulgaris]|uniref:Uncharacterized protein n=1 Tax=Octopus vulgaris TaxID=6645 RepID=A0AA36FLA4_OCTVU|nr:Hypothetical predicted protein [Octopus vulgaris]